MSRWNDPLHEMRGARIDEGTLDRLLQGRILPDDAPPGYSEVASILVAAASRPTDVELRLQGPHVAAAREAIGRRNRRRRPGPLGLVTGALLLALLLIPGLAAAKLLPEPAQHAVTNVLEKVGMTVPTNPAEPTSVPTAGRTRPASPPAVHPDNKGAVISSIATTTNATGVAKGAEISTVASGGKSQAGRHGKAADAPHGSPNAPGGDGASASTHTTGPSGNGAAHASARAAGGQAHP